MLLNQSSRRKLGFKSFATYCTYVLAELMDLYAYAGPVVVPGDLGVSLSRPLKVGVVCARWKWRGCTGASYPPRVLL